MAPHTLIALAIVACCLTTPALACSEDEIHKETVACYNRCLNNPPTQNACVAGCLAEQDRAREACPSISCKIVAGMKICT